MCLAQAHGHAVTVTVIVTAPESVLRRSQLESGVAASLPPSSSLTPLSALLKHNWSSPQAPPPPSPIPQLGLSVKAGQQLTASPLETLVPCSWPGRICKLRGRETKSADLFGVFAPHRDPPTGPPCHCFCLLLHSHPPQTYVAEL
ncbi:hypothetical protein MATL_G00087670 [Megalops atlanticus]|uniref:Uncharacterized protein n=1 Tax=Megalops atlanticus TaxID=7932 RepID=A0A9D3TFK9_MEGAT|nr:hypothetical protein MATL_G00087670 [Megalops atlanticus]